jgi:hypothetical protein
MILTGRRFELVTLVVICVIIYYFIYRSRKGRVPEIRTLPAIDALEEAVGRAVELGKEVHYTTGLSGLDTAFAPQTIAGLSIMQRVTRICGELSVPIRYTAARSYMIPIAEDMIRAGYRYGGVPEKYSPNMVVYVGENQSAFQASVVSYLMAEKPAVNMMFGGITAEAIQTLGAGAVAGSMQFAGTARMFYFPFITLLCDYSLIGEELFAAASTVSGSEVEKGTIMGQDISKFVIIGLLVLGIILTTMGTGLFNQLINL